PRVGRASDTACVAPSLPAPSLGNTTRNRRCRALNAGNPSATCMTKTLYLPRQVSPPPRAVLVRLLPILIRGFRGLAGDRYKPVTFPVPPTPLIPVAQSHLVSRTRETC